MEKFKAWFLGLPMLARILLIFAVVGVVFAVIVQDEMEQRAAERAYKAKRAAMTPEDLRKEKIQEAFSGYDGSHLNLTRYVKKQMNDPGSFQHVSTQYADMGTYIYLEMSFRGKNALGNLVLQTVKAKAKIDGELIEVNTL